MATSRFATHDECFDAVASESAAILRDIQKVVEAAVPDAAPCIAYQMPAYRRGRVFFYFAAFKKHIGIYPPIHRDAGLIAETSAFRGPKGNLSFPLDKPIPYELIGRIASALAQQYSAPQHD
jgi:uncharacterized protein YdhG (YjbR/CyaY superfamily)